MNIRVQSKWWSAASGGSRSVVTSMLQSVKQTAAPQPKYCRNFVSSNCVDPPCLFSRRQITLAASITSLRLGFVGRCRFRCCWSSLSMVVMQKATHYTSLSNISAKCEYTQKCGKIRYCSLKDARITRNAAFSKLLPLRTKRLHTVYKHVSRKSNICGGRRLYGFGTVPIVRGWRFQEIRHFLESSTFSWNVHPFLNWKPFWYIFYADLRRRLEIDTLSWNRHPFWISPCAGVRFKNLVLNKDQLKSEWTLQSCQSTLIEFCRFFYRVISRLIHKKLHSLQKNASNFLHQNTKITK